MIMKIGIKYCGGCNPTYDRTDVVSRLKLHIGQDDIVETAKQGINYDIVVLLCGCDKACANYQDMLSNHETVCITSESDSIKLINMIDKRMMKF